MLPGRLKAIFKDGEDPGVWRSRAVAGRARPQLGKILLGEVRRLGGGAVEGVQAQQALSFLLPDSIVGNQVLRNLQRLPTLVST